MAVEWFTRDGADEIRVKHTSRNKTRLTVVWEDIGGCRSLAIYRMGNHLSKWYEVKLDFGTSVIVGKGSKPMDALRSAIVEAESPQENLDVSGLRYLYDQHQKVKSRLFSNQQKE